MATALKIFSFIAMVLGFFALIGSANMTGQDLVYGLIGGALFFTQGLLAVIYVKQTEK